MVKFRSKRVKNIDTVMSDLGDIQREKILAEINSLKTQRRIAIWTAILSPLGALIAFLILNSSQIKDFISPTPKIRLIVDDPFLERTAVIKITNLVSKEQETVIATTVKETVEWLPLLAGSYRLFVMVNDKSVYSHDFYLRNGDAEPIVIPSRDIGNIRVIVKNNTSNPTPGTALDISVDASGNGYLWVFNYNKDDSLYKLIYPDISSANFNNKIEANKTYYLPDESRIGIIAEDVPGEEKLLFVVTSSRNHTFAQQIATRMSQVVIAKARSQIVEENWGIAELSYRTGS